MNIDQIIAKVLAGKATSEELSALDTWKQEAQDNIKAIKEMQAIDTAVIDIKEYKTFDVDAAWKQFEHGMEKAATEPVQERSTDKSAKLFNMALLRNVAAACAVIALGVFGWQWMSDSNLAKDSNAPLVSSEKILDSKLADGSAVKLDKHTTLTPTGTRAVVLEGRAFFDIIRDEKNQFTVELPAGNITVLGTEFVVDTRDGDIQIYVQEGKVRYEHKGRKVELNAGDRLIMHGGDITKTVSDGKAMTSWLNKKLAFRNEPLTTVVQSLSERFGTKIVIDDLKSTSKCKVNTTIQNESFEEVLNELSVTLGLKYHNIDNVIHIVHSDC